MSSQSLFVTGMHRSGTTLLGRLLDELSGVSVLSQPFPLLYVHVKRSFLRALGTDDPYPIGNLFLEDRYDRTALENHLSRWRITGPELVALFAEMAFYSGQATRFTREELDRAFAQITGSDDFVSVVEKLNRLLARDSRSSWFGSKETICEEFVPSFLDRGLRCVVVIRDPRDVIASLNHGRGEEFGGLVKPTLFNIRSWRKSVAHVLALEGRAGFRWCRYEDLVRDPAGTIAQIAEGFGIEGAPRRREVPLRDPGGAVWLGNSSHGEREGIFDSSVGAHERLLDAGARRLIEASCFLELRLLGYETTLSAEQAGETLRDITEPYSRTRRGMERDEAGEVNSRLECERLARVAEAPGPDSERWFVYERAHARLRQALRQ
jgi:hypothetical protein